jgi:hypothetical protein
MLRVKNQSYAAIKDHESIIWFEIGAQDLNSKNFHLIRRIIIYCIKNKVRVEK